MLSIKRCRPHVAGTTRLLRLLIMASRLQAISELHVLNFGISEPAHSFKRDSTLRSGSRRRRLLACP